MEDRSGPTRATADPIAELDALLGIGAASSSSTRRSAPTYAAAPPTTRTSQQQSQLSATRTSPLEKEEAVEDDYDRIRREVAEKMKIAEKRAVVTAEGESGASATALGLLANFVSTSGEDGWTHEGNTPRGTPFRMHHWHDYSDGDSDLRESLTIGRLKWDRYHSQNYCVGVQSMSIEWNNTEGEKGCRFRHQKECDSPGNMKDYKTGDVGQMRAAIAEAATGEAMTVHQFVTALPTDVRKFIQTNELGE